MKSFVIVVALCVLGVQTASAQTADYVSDTCLSMGLAFPVSCQAEIGAAQSFFGIELNNLDSLQEVDITTQQIAEFVSLLGETDVSNSCCEAMCNFQNHFCGCNETLMQLAEGFIGDMSIVSPLMEAISQSCSQMPVYFGDTCPAEEEAARIAPTDCAQFVTLE